MAEDLPSSEFALALVRRCRPGSWLRRPQWGGGPCEHEAEGGEEVAGEGRMGQVPGLEADDAIFEVAMPAT